ncbi:MAG: hypothetical protein AAFV72_00470 [Cyanobacteria bacterium J06635_1]
MNTNMCFSNKPIQLTSLAIGLSIALVGCKAAPLVQETLPLPEGQSETLPPPDLAEAPPPPPTGSFFGLLPPEANADLAALEIPAAVPSYLPDGFTLADYETGQNQSSGPGGGAYYWLIYRDAQNRCFTVEYTSGGVGGIVLENQLPISSPLFGPGYSLYYGQYEDASLREQFPEPDLFSDWMSGEQGLYRLVGAEQTMQTYEQTNCADLDPQEAVKIVESLTYLETEITGDG